MSSLCCLCLTESENTTIIDNESHEICQKIEICLQLKVYFNGVKAAKICNECIRQLTSAHEFFTKIHKVQLLEDDKEQLKLLPCEQESKTLPICQAKLSLNNNCLHASLEDGELNIKDELMEEEEGLQHPNDSLEESYSDSENSEVERKTPNALATMKNWKSYPWYCFLCIYSTMSYSTLMEHMKSKHDITSTKKMQYQCVDCTKKLTNYALFLNHVRSEHQQALKLCCDICSELFGDYMKLAEHRREHNDGSNVEQPFVFHCNHCSKVYPSRQAINKHVLTHDQGLNCQICDKSFKRLKYLKRHMEMHAELKHKCDFCNKTFHRRFNKITHERTHTGERPYKCDQCDKSFTFQSTMKSHQRTHTNELPYKCEQCSSKFRHLNSLKEHMHVHTKESPFSCMECDETFRYRKSFNRHLRRHTVKKTVQLKNFTKNTKITESQKTSTSSSDLKKKTKTAKARTSKNLKLT